MLTNLDIHTVFNTMLVDALKGEDIVFMPHKGGTTPEANKVYVASTIEYVMPESLEKADQALTKKSGRYKVNILTPATTAITVDFALSSIVERYFNKEKTISTLFYVNKDCHIYTEVSGIVPVGYDKTLNRYDTCVYVPFWCLGVM